MSSDKSSFARCLCLTLNELGQGHPKKFSKKMGQLKTLGIVALLLGGIVVALADSNIGESVARKKRQIPILADSYFERSGRPSDRPLAPFEIPDHDSEGLRLYEDLWASKGRNQPRSLDSSFPFGQNGIQPHHRQSAAWSEKKEMRRYSSASSSSRSGSGLQTRAGGSVHDDLPVELIPSGFGPSTGPRFSEEITYRRSNAGRRNGGSNLQTRSMTSVPVFNCVTCRRASTSGASSAGSRHELRSLGHNSEEVASSSSASGSQAHSEGLRLYNKWLSQSQTLGGGARRNQLRSLDTDNEEDLLGQHSSSNGILPHHRNSGSWSRREERRQSSRRSSQTVTVSGGAPLPAVLPAVDSPAPQFSEEVTYRRNGGDMNGPQTRSFRRSSADNARASSNQLRSLDHAQSWVPPVVTAGAAPGGGVTRHSEAWEENEERRHHQSSSSSGGRNTIQNGGEVRVTNLENRAEQVPAHQSEEITYRRQSSGRRGNGGCSVTVNGANGESSFRNVNCTRVSPRRRTSGQSQGHQSSTSSSDMASAAETRSLSSNAGTYRCRTCDTSRSSSVRSLNQQGSQSHQYRTSRVPVTDDFLIPAGNGNYPPVQTLGQGDGQVDARILHSNDDNDEEQHVASENGGHSGVTGNGVSSGGKQTRKAYYRRTVFKNYTQSAYPASAETWLGA